MVDEKNLKNNLSHATKVNINKEKWRGQHVSLTRSYNENHTLALCYTWIIKQSITYSPAEEHSIKYLRIFLKISKITNKTKQPTKKPWEVITGKRSLRKNCYKMYWECIVLSRTLSWDMIRDFLIKR